MATPSAGYGPCGTGHHATVAVVIIYPAFSRVMAPVVKLCGLLIVFDLFELFLTRILVTRYCYYYYMTVWLDPGMQKT